MHACVHGVQRILPKTTVILLKGEVSIWTFTIIIYLRLDVFLLKAIKCITLSTCEAWQVVVYPGAICCCHKRDSVVYVCMHEHNDLWSEVLIIIIS